MGVGVIRLTIPKDFTFFVTVFKRGKWSSVKYIGPLLIFPDGDMLSILIAQELIANIMDFPPYIMEDFFSTFVLACIKVLSGKFVFFLLFEISHRLLFSLCDNDLSVASLKFKGSIEFLLSLS